MFKPLSFIGYVINKIRNNVIIVDADFPPYLVFTYKGKSYQSLPKLYPINNCDLINTSFCKNDVCHVRVNGIRTYPYRFQNIPYKIQYPLIKYPII